MIDIAELAATALPYLTAYFSDTATTAVDASKRAIGNKIAAWLEDKLKGSADEAALEKLKEAPDSAGSQRSAEGAILTLLERDSSFAAELARILEQAGSDDHSIRQKAKSKGDSSPITQVAGSNNIVGR